MSIRLWTIENGGCEHNRDILLALSNEQLGIIAREVLRSDHRFDEWMCSCHCEDAVQNNDETKSDAALKAVLNSMCIPEFMVDSTVARL